MKARAAKAFKAGLISARERNAFLKAYKVGMRGYTYFEK
jgi:hypothetical protein